jgi:hypothetical protein
MLIIGGAAIAAYKASRRYSDIDVIATNEDSIHYFGKDLTGKASVLHGEIEIHNADHLNNAALLQLPFAWGRVAGLQCSVRIATIPYLYAIKRSHMHRPLAFSKHFMDMIWLKSQTTEEQEREIAGFLKERKRLTYQFYGQNVPSLKKSNDDFFDDPVDKIYVHDDLHEVVAFYDRPIYTKLKFDDGLAHCERQLWDQLCQGDRVKCVQEEAMVIALERFIIPKRLKSPRMAFLKALEKICTTLTSGWFRDFAIDNYEAVASNVPDFVSIFERNKEKCRKLQKL